MKTLSVITTTYNRAYCLHQLYDSLCRQTSNDFIWIVIDDGSSDNTQDLIELWKSEKVVDIEYYYKENGGMHTARNLAYEKVHTELNTIIDSDDWMTDSAVETIISFWKKYGNDSFYGIVSENIDPQGRIIGNRLPNVKSATLTDVFEKYHASGDKKLILRSDLSHLFPFPEFPGEKFYPASYKYKMLDQKYELLIMPVATCVVDYNENSMSFDKYKQYRTCAKGFAHYRNQVLVISKSPKTVIKTCIHYIAESIFAGNKHYIRNCKKPLLAIACWPFGIGLYIYLARTKNKY